MTIEQDTLERRLVELETRLRNLEEQEKMGFTTQVGGTYKMIQDIEDDEDAQVERLLFGFYDTTDEDGTDIGETFGFRIRDNADATVMEVDEDGISLPAIPMNLVPGGTQTVTSTSYASVWTAGCYTIPANALRIGLQAQVTAGSADIRIANLSQSTFSNAINVTSTGWIDVDFRWEHGETLSSGPHQFGIQARKNVSGSLFLSTPYVAAFSGTDRMNATVGGT